MPRPLLPPPVPGASPQCTSSKRSPCKGEGAVRWGCSGYACLLCYMGCAEGRAEPLSCFSLPRVYAACTPSQVALWEELFCCLALLGAREQEGSLDTAAHLSPHHLPSICTADAAMQTSGTSWIAVGREQCHSTGAELGKVCAEFNGVLLGKPYVYHS